MRSNPLVIEALLGTTRQGKAQLDYLVLLAIQALVVVLWWPKDGVVQVLESQHGPDTLIAVVIAVGITTAYHALRAGAEEFLLPGQQHRLRDWALATPVSLGRVVYGYVLGRLVHVIHLLALSSPLVLVAFTVSGGEWHAVALCMAAALVQAMVYALSGAAMHLAIGQHPAECHFFVRAILVVVYLPIGWLAPFTSHVAFTSRALGEGVQTQAAFPGVPDPWAFMVLYMGLSMFLALAVYLLLMRSRARMAGPRGDPNDALMP